MLPFSFEWVWDSSHFVFHGFLWFALHVMGIAMTFCIIKAIYDTVKGKGADHH